MTVERVESDPLAKQAKIAIFLTFKLFNSLQPATGPVEADVGWVLRYDLSKTLFVRLPTPT